MEQIHRAIHEAVLDAGPKQVAHKMGTSHTSLLNRANPNDDTHRLNVEQLLQILLHTQDMRPLHAMAAEFGYELVPLRKLETLPLTTAVLRMTKEVADVTQVVVIALEDGHVSQTEKATIKREISHAREALNALEGSVNAA